MISHNKVTVFDLVDFKNKIKPKTKPIVNNILYEREKILLLYGQIPNSKNNILKLANSIATGRSFNKNKCNYKNVLYLTNYYTNLKLKLNTQKIHNNIKIIPINLNTFYGVIDKIHDKYSKSFCLHKCVLFIDLQSILCTGESKLDKCNIFKSELNKYKYLNKLSKTGTSIVFLKKLSLLDSFNESVFIYLMDRIIRI